MVKDLFQFLKSRTFLKHLFIYVLSFFLLSWLIFACLDSYTSHGETLEVPDFKGQKLSDLDRFVSDKRVRYLVIDSLYDVKAKPGVVVKQEPESGEKVKENRTIYLYVTSLKPPSIQMPKLVDASLRQASSMIATYGLKLGKVKFVPDQCANCVLDQLVKGKKIAPGATIPKGTVIDLIVGKGLSEEEVGVPCLAGLTKSEALERLAENSLSLGALSYDVPKDSASARVYRQSPSCGKEVKINMGSTVDLFLSADKSKWPEAEDPAKQNEDEDNGFD